MAAGAAAGDGAPFENFSTSFFVTRPCRPVGGTVFERSLAALAPGGRLVTPGAVESPLVSLNLWPLIGKRARIIGASGGSVTSEAFERLIELAGKGELTPVVDRELPLDEAAEAHRLIEAREVFGKIVLRP